MTWGIKLSLLAIPLVALAAAGYCRPAKEIPIDDARRIASQFTRQADWGNELAPEKFVKVRPFEKWRDLRPVLQLESDRQNYNRWVVTIDRENGEVLSALLFLKAIHDARPRFCGPGLFPLGTLRLLKTDFIL